MSGGIWPPVRRPWWDAVEVIEAQVLSEVPPLARQGRVQAAGEETAHTPRGWPGKAPRRFAGLRAPSTGPRVPHLYTGGGPHELTL